MLDHIVKINAHPDLGPMFSKEDISIDQEARFDRRIGWRDCRYVLIARYGSQIYAHPQCIGYCATKFPFE